MVIERYTFIKPPVVVKSGKKRSYDAETIRSARVKKSDSICREQFASGHYDLSPQIPKDVDRTDFGGKLCVNDDGTGAVQISGRTINIPYDTYALPVLIHNETGATVLKSVVRFIPGPSPMTTISTNLKYSEIEFKIGR